LAAGAPGPAVIDKMAVKSVGSDVLLGQRVDAGTATMINSGVRSAERNAMASSCCGVLGETVLTDSAVIILFAGLLGASEGFTLLTTSLLPLSNGLCILPMAWVAAHTGNRRLVLMASALAGGVYFMAAAAPWFLSGASAVLLVSVFFFSLSLSGFVAGWFPLLDAFLEPDRRIPFFGWMRFCHQIVSVAFLFIVGLVIGKHPQVRQLQAVLFISAVIFLGRMLFISRIPVFSATVKESLLFRKGLSAAVANRPLVGFSIYMFVLNLSAYGVVPLTLLYLKKQLHAPDNVTIIISSVALSGMLLGYSGVGRLIRRWRVKGVLLALHVVFALVSLALFSIGTGNALSYFVIALLLLLHNFAVAAASIVASSEMLALSTLGNKTMDMAFCGALFYGGQGLSRLCSSLLLGAGSSAVQWHMGGFTVSRYQFGFLLCAVSVTLTALFLKKEKT